DNKHARHPERWPRENIRVGEFPTKIKAAQKSKHFAEGRSVLAPQSQREFKLRPLVHDHAGALTTCVSGRQEKNAAHPRMKRSCDYRLKARSLGVCAARDEGCSRMRARVRFACSSGRCLSDHRQSARRGSISDRPRRVSEYSTLGGVTG